MAKITLDDLVNLQNEQSAVNTINNNNEAIEAALELTLTRTGTSPNEMESDLDMNAHRIINLPLPVADTEPVRKGEFDEWTGLAEDLETAVESAENSANAAAVSAAAALVAQQGAESILDEFDDIYLGPKATDPLVDNDGDPLQEGQIYWNTSDKNLRVYNGSSWEIYDSGLANVSDDTSPSLGGNLDLNNFNIGGTGNISSSGTISATTINQGPNNVVDDSDIGVTVQGYSSNLAGWATQPTSNFLTTGVAASTYLTTGAAASTYLTQAAAVAGYQPLDSDLTAIAALATTTGGRSVLAMADPNTDRVLAWDDSAGSISPITLANITSETTPASGDYFLMYRAEGDLVKANWSSLPAGGLQYVIDPADYGVVGDGTTDDTAAIQAACDAARAIADPKRYGSDLYGTRVVVDFTGYNCLITDEIVLNDHGFVTVQNLSMTASASWVGATTDYMLNCAGTSFSNAHLHIINPVLNCNRECNGIYISNAPRSKIWNPVMKRMLTRGITVGASVWLSEFTGGGSIHEYDSGDSERDDDTPGVRTATGLYIDSGSGDFEAYLRIGFIKTCVHNAGSGVIQLGGHWYCSSPVNDIDGEIYIHENSGSVTIINNCYLDTGRFVYKGGYLHLGDGCVFFHNTPVVPPALDAYIHMQSTATGAYSLLTMGNIRYNVETTPVFKDTSTTGSWVNVTGPSFFLGNKNHIISNQELMLSVNSDTNTPVRIQGRKPSAGAYLAFEAPSTTYAPQVGVNSGNNFEVFLEGTRKFRVHTTGVLLDNKAAAFRAYPSASITGIGDATFTTVVWNTEEFDVGSYYSTTTGTWTPPAGIVRLDSNARLQGTMASGANSAIRIRKNGTAIANSNSWDDSTSDRVVSVGITDVANGSDAYDVQVFCDVSSGTVTVNTGSPTGSGSYFSGMWIGNNS